MKIYISPSSQTANMYSGIRNTSEAATCRMIGEKVYDLLNGYKDLNVKLATAGYTVAQRISESNKFMPDYHICIHTNAGGGQGTTMYCYQGNADDLMAKIYQSVADLTPTQDRGIQSAMFAEIIRTEGRCIYLEVEFHDNSDLAVWITNNIVEIAESIAKPILESIGAEYREPVQNTQGIFPDNKPRYVASAGVFESLENAKRMVQIMADCGITGAVLPR